MDMLIRDEAAKDVEAIYSINAAVFPTPAEAALVNRLREEASPIISLVAEIRGEIAGHVLFSPVILAGFTDLRIMGLGPLAVSPALQKNGMGSGLVYAGLARCKGLGAGAAVVLGHPGYYPRFGFRPSSEFGIWCEFPAPPEAFMVIELQPGYLQGASGTIYYHPAFQQV